MLRFVNRKIDFCELIQKVYKKAIETKQYVDKLVKKENIYELCKKCKNDSDSGLYCGEFGGMWNE